MKLRIAATAVIGLTLIVALFQVNAAKAVWTDPYNIVDVLMMFDEEFRANPTWMNEAEATLEDVSNTRFAESNIKFYARGRLAWNSDDQEDDAKKLMQEALEDSGLPKKSVQYEPGKWNWGFESGSEWVDDNGLPWYIDLLLIFVGQPCYPDGYSPPMFNMTIIEDDFRGSARVMTHELTHQFISSLGNENHCDKVLDCVMYESPRIKFFCGSCRDELTENADKWHMNEYTPLAPTGKSTGYRWTTYTYTARVINPDGADIKYQFDWGDGTSGWTGYTYDSGESGSLGHKWNSIGSYLIRTRAKDGHNHYSSWSPYKKLNIIRKPGFPCPTLFVWNGSQYVEVGALDIHGDSDVTFLQGIEQTLVPEKHLYKLSLRELDEFTSHIDYVKLYVVDNDVQKHECHLVQAVHSELKHVEGLLLQDDNKRVDLTPLQTIDLKFTAPDINEIAYFIFEINGYNIKP